MIDIELNAFEFMAMKTWEYGTNLLILAFKWCPILNKNYFFCREKWSWDDL